MFGQARRHRQVGFRRPNCQTINVRVYAAFHRNAGRVLPTHDSPICPPRRGPLLTRDIHCIPSRNARDPGFHILRFWGLCELTAHRTLTRITN
jgi:hypothetical protein